MGEDVGWEILDQIDTKKKVLKLIKSRVGMYKLEKIYYTETTKKK